MGSLSTGGGTSAVAASAHAGCPRFVRTDPLVTSISRRDLATRLGHPDTSAGIPAARWVRAMTFERLVRNERFVSQLITTAVGGVGLARPKAVRRATGSVNVDETLTQLHDAHRHAADDVATMITDLGVPFVGMEDQTSATFVKPDFAVVAPRFDGDSNVGSWLIMGDAKDYERVRSRIDDPRMLKGFLQVALGAESAEAWSALPDGMVVHDWGALAVPRNAFLQPVAIVERLDDHREEVRVKAAERRTLMDEVAGTIAPDSDMDDYVRHLEAEFDPATCVTCAMFNVCRNELRESSEPESVLVELGLRPEMRAALAPLLTDRSPEAAAASRVPVSVVAQVEATVTGKAQWSGQRRVDPAGSPGSIHVVLAKSDSAALGVHGLGMCRVDSTGEASDWSFSTFINPQSPLTRTAIMGLLGSEIEATPADGTTGTANPVTLVIPDAATADLLVSIADSLAGIETSRLRWQRDIDTDREPLTFDGETATVPDPLTKHERLAVSFLLEEDRARAMTLRWPLVNVHTMLSQHLTAGGPAIESGRLDYLLAWAEAAADEVLDHRAVTDEIASRNHTPGARMSNRMSDSIHACIDPQRDGTHDSARYRTLVIEELAYKAVVVDRAIAALDKLDDSALRVAHRALEFDAQTVWRTRLALHASDLVRFGRTGWVWRNSQVDMLDADNSCAAQLSAVGNPQTSIEMARNAGTRELAMATVTSVNPLRLQIGSRRITDGSTIVALQINGEPCLETDEVTLKIQKGSFKLANLSLGPLVADEDGDGLLWDPKLPPSVEVGDELVIADSTWFGNPLKSGHEINIARPKADTQSAPKGDCDANSYEQDPEEHEWCCRSHEVAEAQWSDELAERRANNEMNPEVWPPIIDTDQFDTPGAGQPTSDTTDIADLEPSPDHLTMDDLD